MIKKAIILAKQDDQYKNIASRFAAIYFLATPHRGSDLARILRNLLRVTYRRAYVSDLRPNSGAIQVINDAFRHVVNIDIFSFYETLKIRMLGSLVVDRDSATLGYRHETQVPVAADHRSICKFDSPSDMNYQLLRNLLAETVEKFSQIIAEEESRTRQDMINVLGRYLGVPDFDGDYIAVQRARVAQSGEWLLRKESFMNWKNGTTPNRIFWVKGRPGSGKSVLAGLVIDMLKAEGLSCSYFFFKSENRSKCRLSTCLRSLAFQMASLDDGVRDNLLELKNDGVDIDHEDTSALWRVFFLSEIFERKLAQHYWVIDAFDGCTDPTHFLGLLSKLDPSLHLRIFITSRDNPELESRFSVPTEECLSAISIEAHETLSDLKLLVEPVVSSLDVLDLDEKASLAQRILNKANGSFIWTTLVLDEVRNVHRKTEIARVLDEVPPSMKASYRRTLHLMSLERYSKDLVREILTWTSCAPRPMSVGELLGALKLHFGEDIVNIERAIGVRCGQLIFIDQCARVQLVHETAREFLIDPGLDSEFALNVEKSHSRMAEICLRCLISEEFSPLRTQPRQSAPRRSRHRPDFANYAIQFWSYHLFKATSQERNILLPLEEFLNTNILSWVEEVAGSQSLKQLEQTSRHLATFAALCDIEGPPRDHRIAIIRRWAADLMRLTTRFSSVLLAYPSAIHTLVPPFCPTKSMLHNSVFRIQALVLLGHQDEVWSDKIFRVKFESDDPTTLCYGDGFMAVGLESGAISLYHGTLYQESRLLYHGETIKHLQINDTTGLLASCGLETIKVWNIGRGECIHTFHTLHRPLYLTFKEGIIRAATVGNYIASWDLENNEIRKPDLFWNHTAKLPNSPLHGEPSSLAMSVHSQLLAVAYLGHPILLWDLAQNTDLGTCGKKLVNGDTSNDQVVEMIFNPNAASGLLAISYLEGDLVAIDPLRNQQLSCVRETCRALCASADGRLLGAVGGENAICIYEFDSLRLIYRLLSSNNSSIRHLAFSKNTLQIADIRASKCSVWEPLSPAIYDGHDPASVPVTEHVSPEVQMRITSIAVHPAEAIIFCGRDDGSIVLHSLNTAEPIATLYRHPSPVKMMAWSQQHKLLFSVDYRNKIISYHIGDLHASEKTAQGQVMFETKLDDSLTMMDLCLGDAKLKFITSTAGSDHLWSFNGQLLETHVEKKPSPGIHKWIQHPSSEDQVVRIDTTEARIFRWHDWSEIACYPLQLDLVLQFSPENLFSFFDGGHMRVLLQLSQYSVSPRTTQLVVFHFEEITRTANGLAKYITLSPPFAQALLDRVSHVLGTTDSGRLVFLDNDSWVCSIAIAEALDSRTNRGDSLELSRHFFIPHDWFAGARDIVSALVNRDIVLSRKDNLVIVRNWEEHVYRVRI